MATISINQRKLSIRATAVAGSFYPKDASQLSNMLNDFLVHQRVATEAPKAIIAPHAGYIYSGLTAASVYATVAKLKEQVNRVVLLGPAHRVYVKGIALASNTHFATPMGNVALDTQALDQLAKQAGVQFLDVAHEQEHSLEVHLPFLQKVLNQFTLIPLLVGDASPEQIAKILNDLWGGEETLIVISSDLSHYLDYEAASRLDNNTTQLIERFDYKNIGSKQACGCMPIRGLLKLAEEKNMTIRTLDLRNSGDTAGTKDRVVGYGAYALFNNRNNNSILNESDKKLVFDIIHKSIQQGLEKGSTYQVDESSYARHLQKNYAVFITLKINGQLRGCIGTTEATMSLIKVIAQYAYAAAFSDPRFTPLTADEYKQTDISLSILTPAKPLSFNDEQDLIKQLRLGIDGLIIAKGNRKATYLPVVWEQIKNKQQFVSELKKKAGIEKTDCPDKAWRYTAEYYS